MKTAPFFADGVGRQDGPFLTTLPGRLSGWGAGGFRTGACPRREPSDGVSESGAAPVSGGEVKKSAAAPF